MPGTSNISVDKEWAASLVGLRMQVADNWWDGCHGSELYPGAISDVNFDDAAGRFFILTLDGDEYTYPMGYDAVVHYADETDRNFYKFHLPDGLLEDPANERVTARSGRGRSRNRPTTTP